VSGEPEPAGPTVVIGAGPAGLSAALALARAGRAVAVIERGEDVGGLARTVERGGFRFDIGGHRFLTDIPEIQAMWREFLADDLLVRPRRSRILYRGRYFDYPLTASSAIAGLTLAESARVLASYVRARLRPIRPELSFADWVTNRFGARLFETFFRSYTEKVWGVRCEALGAAWAAERIRGLSLAGAIADMLRRGAGGHRTLATEFLYPRLGPGMLWSRMRAEIERLGGRVLLRRSVVALRVAGDRVAAVEVESRYGREAIPAAAVVSTMPLRDLVAALSPPLPGGAVDAARRLRYRDFLEVVLVMRGGDPFPDTWLYLHDPEIRAGRIQNFRAWSPELVPEADRACVGLEYFCDAGDALWTLPDARLADVAVADLERLGFGAPGEVVDAHVVRMQGAYPIYDDGFDERLATIRAALDRVANLAVAGRAGMHRYDNMDRSMLSGLVAARKALGEPVDPWAIRAGGGLLEPGGS
jgi:protoporphyrinogen oxidase